MQTTVDPSAGPDAARLALKLVEWNYGVLCKVISISMVIRRHLSAQLTRLPPIAGCHHHAFEARQADLQRAATPF